MGMSARPTTLLDSVSNLAVIGLTILIGTSFFLGRGPFKPLSKPARSAVQDIATQNPKAHVTLVTNTARVGQPVIIEVSDFQCPFCRRFATETLPQVKKDLLDSNTVAYGFINLPLESIHPDAMTAAKSLACARNQKRFWEMHAWLFDRHGDFQ